ncbi:MAG: hypothetical protein ACI9JN_002080 [Bacteroidia bacterium]|jgi:hypothetical protein
MAAKNKKAEEIKKSKPVYHMTFNKENYTWMIIGFAIIVLGFILMVGKTDDIFDNAEIFTTGEKSFSTIVKITIAPIVVLIGFAVEIYAIFKNSSSVENEPS